MHVPVEEASLPPSFPLFTFFPLSPHPFFSPCLPPSIHPFLASLIYLFVCLIVCYLQRVADGLSQLDELLVTLEQSIKDVIKDCETKKKVWAQLKSKLV